MAKDADGNVIEPTTPPETEPAGDTTPAGDGEGGAGKAPGSSTSGGKTAAEWETTYKGLQGSYQKLKDESDKIIADQNLKITALTESVETLTQGGTSKDTQAEVLQQQIAKLTEEKVTLSGEKDKADAKIARNTLIMKDYPELAHWEAEGLLPEAEGEDAMKESFDKFRTTLTGSVGTEVKEKLKGATPVGSGATSTTTKEGEGEESLDYVWDRMVEFAGRDQKQYNEWQVKWDALNAKKVKEMEKQT